jgi:hypothetical protein
MSPFSLSTSSPWPLPLSVSYFHASPAAQASGSLVGSTVLDWAIVSVFRNREQTDPVFTQHTHANDGFRTVCRWSGTPSAIRSICTELVPCYRVHSTISRRVTCACFCFVLFWRYPFIFRRSGLARLLKSAVQCHQGVLRGDTASYRAILCGCVEQLRYAMPCDRQAGCRPCGRLSLAF